MELNGWPGGVLPAGPPASSLTDGAGVVRYFDLNWNRVGRRAVGLDYGRQISGHARNYGSFQSGDVSRRKIVGGRRKSRSRSLARWIKHPPCAANCTGTPQRAASERERGPCQFCRSRVDHGSPTVPTRRLADHFTGHACTHIYPHRRQMASSDVVYEVAVIGGGVVRASIGRASVHPTRGVVGQLDLPNRRLTSIITFRPSYRWAAPPRGVRPSAGPRPGRPRAACCCWSSSRRAMPMAPPMATGASFGAFNQSID